jgi:hypothetical protein
MFKLKSIDHYRWSDGRFVYIVESPVSCARTFEAMRGALGEEVEIDGNIVKPKGYEFRMLCD